MFRGQFEHAMDAKGRISLPSRYREAMQASNDERLIVTRGLGDPATPWLDVYPLKRWEEFEQRVSQLPRFDPNVIKLRRLYVSAAVECELDGQGRILVPPSLREHARLDKAVVWAGMIEKAELWSSDLWAEAQKAAAQDMSFLNALGEQLRL
jgi:MraZ protein